MYVGYEEEKNGGKFFFVSNLFFSINFGVKKGLKIGIGKKLRGMASVQKEMATQNDG